MAAGILGLIVFLPLLGAMANGRDLRPLWKFPPEFDLPSDYPRFSWFAVSAIIVMVGALAASWIGAGPWKSANDLIRETRVRAEACFPWWGWLATGWVVMWWILAWTRFSWFEMAQRFTFFPLWLGFIVAVNALTFRQKGSCFMLTVPRRWLGLFATSAVFWWIFEWLNRFVRNWHYLGVEDFGPWSYSFHASLCFATVLPAVAAVAEWLGTYERLISVFARCLAWPWIDRRGMAVIFCLGGAIGLAGAGAFPTWFYPALWVSPLMIGLGVTLRSRRTPLRNELARGNWIRAGLWMIAALICGFFWELWNWHSLAKWVYTVPGVERWHLFEMPLLGYVGYLPFGVECLLVAEHVMGSPLRGTAHARVRNESESGLT